VAGGRIWGLAYILFALSAFDAAVAWGRLMKE
jgi:hypothetical protein